MAVTDLTGDAAAIAVLHESFEAQKAAFLNDPYPSAAERRERVLAVADQVVRNRMGIREAMSSDFAVHPELFSDMVEVLGMAAAPPTRRRTWSSGWRPSRATWTRPCTARRAPRCVSSRRA